MFTRMVINAVVDPEADDDAVTARLLQNPKGYIAVAMGLRQGRKLTD